MRSRNADIKTLRLLLLGSLLHVSRERLRHETFPLVQLDPKVGLYASGSTVVAFAGRDKVGAQPAREGHLRPRRHDGQDQVPRSSGPGDTEGSGHPGEPHEGRSWRCGPAWRGPAPGLLHRLLGCAPVRVRGGAGPLREGCRPCLLGRVFPSAAFTGIAASCCTYLLLRW